MKVHVSSGNMKVKFANVSLVPIKDCTNCELCKTKCYALKAYRLYPSVRNAWSNNSKAFRTNPNEACSFVSGYINGTKTKYFRIHVAGDFLNQEHLDSWVETAKENNKTKFLSFTKAYDLNYSKVPGNMNIMFSVWPGMKNNVPTEFPKAYVGKIEGVYHCHGKCHECKVCWETKQNIYFDLH